MNVPWPRIKSSFSARQMRRQMRRMGFVSPADAPEGTPVCIRGIVRALDPTRLLEAPLSGRRCVYYAACVDLDIAGGLTMRPHVRDTRARSFAIECAGDVIVDPEHARIAARFDHESTSLAAFDASARERALLDLAPVEQWFVVRGVHYYEAILAPGHPVAVLGAATRELDPRGIGTYRQPGTRMHFAGTPAHPLLIAGDPDD